MTEERDPLAGDHFCGDFPGAGGVMLRNYVMIYRVNWEHEDAPMGWYWWNAKEGNGTTKGGPFPTAWACFAGAMEVYPLMSKGERHALWLSLSPVVVYAPRRGLRRMVR